MTASHDIGNQAPAGPRAGPSAGDGATPPVGDGATPPVGDGATPPVEKNELARRSVTGFEVFGQSLAATGPTISIGTLAVVYLIAGQGTMWSYILATVVAVLVGYSIAQFARRTAAAGSLYTYTASGLGRSTAFAGGWGLIFGYVLMAAACLAGAALYFGAFLAKLGLNGESRPWQLPLLVVFLVPTVAILIRGIRISTRVAVTLEIISLVAISVLLIALFVHYGARFDTGQFKATGSSATGIALGTVVAVSGFVGFESSSSLGIEARSPHRSIPRAILFTVLAVGVLYIVAAYGEVLGFGSAASLASSSAPLNHLSATAGVSWLAYYLDLAVTISAVACAAACLNAAARGVYSLGREDILPGDFGRSHSKFKTPHVAIYALAPVVGAVPFVMAAYGTSPLHTLAYVDTVATFGYLVAYLLVSIAVPFFLARRKALTPLPVIVTVLAAAAIGYVLYKTLIPVPPGPYNTFPYIFLAWIVIGLAWYLALKVRDPARAARLGTLQERETADLESRIAAELIPETESSPS
jgi:amino acid transporter